MKRVARIMNVSIFAINSNVNLKLSHSQMHLIILFVCLATNDFACQWHNIIFCDITVYFDLSEYTIYVYLFIYHYFNTP